MTQETFRRSLVTGQITRIDLDGTVVIEIADPEEPAEIRCLVLESAVMRSPLSVADTVVAIFDALHDDRGVILGRLGLPLEPRHLSMPGVTVRTSENPEDRPETLVLEAKEELTLKVGDGSITIRKDGKILIKGSDLVSHAQRMNRIKGGAVSIN